MRGKTDSDTPTRLARHQQGWQWCLSGVLGFHRTAGETALEHPWETAAFIES